MPRNPVRVGTLWQISIAYVEWNRVYYNDIVSNLTKHIYETNVTCEFGKGEYLYEKCDSKIKNTPIIRKIRRKMRRRKFQL